VTLLEESSAPVIMLRQALHDGWPSARADLVSLYRATGTEVDGGIALPLAYTVATLVAD
jgi:hypothetical protein